jgi:hypothetical protein
MFSYLLLFYYHPLTVAVFTVTPLTITPLTITPLTITPLTITPLTITPLTITPQPLVLSASAFFYCHSFPCVRLCTCL